MKTSDLVFGGLVCAIGWLALVWSQHNQQIFDELNIQLQNPGADQAQALTVEPIRAIAKK